MAADVPHDGLELGDRRYLPFDGLGLLPALAQEFGGRLRDDPIFDRNVEELLEEAGVAVVRHVPEPWLFVGQPLVQHGRADGAYLEVPAVRPPGQEALDDAPIGDPAAL